MLLETLFCIGFFLLPLVGMFMLVIRAAIKMGVPDKLRSEKLRSQGSRGKLDINRFKKRNNTYGVPVFANSKVLDYQLIESKNHQSLYLNIMKERANPRAGP